MIKVADVELIKDKLFTPENLIYQIYIYYIIKCINWVRCKIKFFEFIRRKKYTEVEKFGMFYESIRFRTPRNVWGKDFRDFIYKYRLSIVEML